MPKEEDERDERNESRRARGERRGEEENDDDDDARERERETYPRVEGGGEKKERETGKQGTQREEERMVRCSRRAHIGSSPSPIGARGVGRV